MALRDLLGSLDYATEATGSLRDTASRMRKEEDLRTLAQQVPGAVESGDYGGLAGEAYALGDPSVLQRIMAGQQSQQKLLASNQPGLDVEGLMNTYGVPESVAKNLEKLSLDEQDRSAKGWQAKGRLDEQKGSRREREDRQKVQNVEDARTQLTDRVRSSLKPLQQDLDKLSGIAQLDSSNATDFWVKATNVIKSVGAEAGALSEQDVGRPFPKNAGSTLRSLGRWMGAIDADKIDLDPKLVRRVDEIIKSAMEKKGEILRQKGLKNLKREALAKRDFLIDKDEKYVDDVIQNYANEFGTVARLNDKGELEFGERFESRETKDADLNKADPEVKQMITSLESEEDKNEASQILKEFMARGDTTSENYKRFINDLATGNF